MRFHTRGVLVLALLIGAIGVPVAAASASSSSSFPLTLKAADGTFTLKSPPKSIVSLSPTSTEILFAIGAGPQVKAVDSDSDYPKDAPITKLSAYTPNVEAIAKYKPDLVVVAEDSASFNSAMAALHVPVLYYDAPTTLKGAYEQYTSLGVATGNVAGAKAEVAKVKTKIASIISSTPKAKPGSTYYYELDPSAYYSVTSSTFVGNLFAKLGLKSIADTAKGAASSGGYPQLSAEFIVKANPTYIFLADGASAKSVGARAGWSAMTAVKDNRIYELNEDIASRWGPRITILLGDAAKAIKASASS